MSVLLLMAVNLKALYRRQILVARVFGIPVRIDYRWFVVFALSVLLIASNLHQHTLQLGTLRVPPTGVVTAWMLGVITTVALFLSVFGHELSHALMGRAEGIEIDEIVLHPFGGLARMRTQPESPSAEFRIAIAGPAASFIFSIFGFAAAKLAALVEFNSALIVFFFVAWGNLLLAVFNLLPGYPLDGGRVLRAILWRRTGSIGAATRLSGICGILVAATLIIFGVYMAVAPSFHAYFMGAWSVLVGIFLLSAAVSIVRSARGPEDVIVAEAMSAPIALEPDLLISRFIDETLPLHRQASFPVAYQRRLLGILSLEDLKALPRSKWRERRARDVMRPVSSSLFIHPSATMAQANSLMASNGAGSLAVIDDAGKLVGFLQRGNLKRRKKP
jgi:Zn-dependent protease